MKRKYLTVITALILSSLIGGGVLKRRKPARRLRRRVQACRPLWLLFPEPLLTLTVSL